MKVAMIGDNCIDFYERLGLSYPTGNVVDTGVHMKKLGLDVSLISTTGTDENGQMMVSTLRDLGLDISHLTVKQGATAVTYMDLLDGERIHGEYVEGVLENMVFSEEDIRFAAEHDLIHSALWGKADSILGEVRKKSRGLISFDYADRLEDPVVRRTAPYVDYGFFSYHSGRDQVIEDFLKEMVAKGMKQAIATLGENGSLVYDGNEFHEYGIFSCVVVNTIGAGDSFIAGYLYGVLNELSIEKCQEMGSKLASEVIGIFGPWRI